MSDKHKFLFIGKDYLAPSIPYKLQEDLGHEVIYYKALKDDKGKEFPASDTYKGMGIKIVTDIKKIEKELNSKEWIKVVEDTLLCNVVKDCIAAGHGVINGYPKIEKWETDREYGQKVAEKIRDWNEKHGECLPFNIHVVERQEFNSADEAISFLEENEGPYVIKESGESAVRMLNYKGELKSNMDVIMKLQHQETHNGMDGGKFTLQKKVEGIEVGVSCFVSRGKPMNFTENDFEHQCLLDKERGMNTGEMENEGVCLERDKNMLYKICLAPLFDSPDQPLKDFTGFININGIVNKDGFNVLEFTIRAAGTPWVHEIWEMLWGKFDYGDFLYNMAMGIDCHVDFNDGYTIGVRVDVPPSIFEGISAKYLQHELEEDDGLLNKFKMIVAKGDVKEIMDFLDEYSVFAEHVKDMPLIIEDYTRDADKHFHFAGAKNLKTFEQNNRIYASFNATETTPIYITANATSPKIAAMKIDNYLDRLSGIRFVTRSDYGEKVQENLEKLEAMGVDMFPDMD